MKSALRLRNSNDFAYVKRNGVSCKNRFLSLSYVDNGLSYNRYGFVTSKKLGNAVIRNRTKRRIREVTYQLHPKLKRGYDIVTIARHAIVEQPFYRLLRIQTDLYQLAKLMREV